MISTGDLKKGVVIEMDGQLFQIMDYQHLKIGRGSAQVRMKLRNVRSGAVVDRTVQAGDKWPRVRLERRNVSYLYEDAPNYVFMDQENFEQISLTRDQLGDAANYLKDGIEFEVLMFEEEPIGVEPPITVELEITNTEPGFRGDTASGGTKPATLETGLVVSVPLFVNQGETIKVDTRTGTYIERVSS
ncbi:MAG: elongation factor [Chloroflexota bacterium]|jgi:elongation factor P|nr:elongation factor [Chloroflexota bacterium]